MEPDGTLDGVMAMYDPKQGKKMKASADHHAGDQPQPLMTSRNYVVPSQTPHAPGMQITGR